MEPVLKWAGGKRSIAKELIERFPEGWRNGTYFEPFFGGGAVYFQAQVNQAVISDVNTRLINFYCQLKSDPEALADAVNRIASSFNLLSEGEHLNRYLQLRTEMNSNGPDGLQNAALLYAMNKLCFNGLYRENRRGEFNVPFSKRTTLTPVSEDDWTEISGYLSNCLILNSSFANTVETAREGDFVYFDPPYFPLTQTANFTAYSADGFGIRDQIRLANTMRKLADRGVKSMTSNSDSYLSNRIYGKFEVEQIPVKRAVGASSASRGKVSELIITTY
jgi:DNA adenine methylase